METFKMKIPDGYTAEVENGEIVYYPIKHKEVSVECTFEIGDIVSYNNILRIIEDFDGNGCIESSKRFQIDTFISEPYGVCGLVRQYSKATSEQEKLFKQKCLENGVWFDNVNKKWIELKEGGFYAVNFYNYYIYFIFHSYNKNMIQNYVSLYSDNVSELGIPFMLDYPFNILETTEEEKQLLLDTMKEKGKCWNYEKKCVEDLKWVPEAGEEYWYATYHFEPCQDNYEGV
ncbi:MAG: hypothetical protein ACRDD8_13205, partial [Bacteroidales bacterium]